MLPENSPDYYISYIAVKMSGLYIPYIAMKTSGLYIPYIDSKDYRLLYCIYPNNKNEHPTSQVLVISMYLLCFSTANLRQKRHTMCQIRVTLEDSKISSFKFAILPLVSTSKTNIVWKKHFVKRGNHIFLPASKPGLPLNPKKRYTHPGHRKNHLLKPGENHMHSNILCKCIFC